MTYERYKTILATGGIVRHEEEARRALESLILRNGVMQREFDRLRKLEPIDGPDAEEDLRIHVYSGGLGDCLFVCRIYGKAGVCILEQIEECFRKNYFDDEESDFAAAGEYVVRPLWEEPEYHEGWGATEGYWYPEILSFTPLPEKPVEDECTTTAPILAPALGDDDMPF